MKLSPNVVHPVLVIALASVFFMWGLGSIGLTDRDEGRNAEAGREMFETGDWITPTFNYEPRFIKPAMLYWLMSASYRVFGENEFAARFPSALFGVGLIALQYLFLAHAHGRTVALFGALMLLLNVEVIGLARMALTDMVLMFFTTLSVFSFWTGFHGAGLQRNWLWVSYAAMACGTLVKGPLGFVIPLLAIIPYLTATHQWRRFWVYGGPVSGLAIFLALAGPWYAAMLALHGVSYSSQAQEHTLFRFFNPFYGWGGTVFFYVPVMLFGFFPWSAFLPVALYEAYKTWKSRGAAVEEASRQNGQGKRDLEFFAALWFLAAFLFFSVGATRLPHYIGPLYPAAAIVAASYWARASETSMTSGLRGALYTMMAVGALFALMFVALPSVFTMFSDKLLKDFPYATDFRFDPSPYAASALLAMGTALIGYLGFSKPRRAGVFWTAGTMIALVILIVLHVTLPQLSRVFLEPPQKLALAAGRVLDPEDRLIVYGPNRPSAVFYAKRKITVVRYNEQDNIRPYVEEANRTMIVLPAALRDKLPGIASDFPVLLERFGWILIAERI